MVEDNEVVRRFYHSLWTTQDQAYIATTKETIRRLEKKELVAVGLYPTERIRMRTLKIEAEVFNLKRSAEIWRFNAITISVFFTAFALSVFLQEGRCFSSMSSSAQFLSRDAMQTTLDHIKRMPSLLGL